MGLCSLLWQACLYTRHDIHITLDIRHIQETASNIEDVVAGEKEIQDIKPKSGAMLLQRMRDGVANLLDPATAAYAQEGAGAIKQMTPKMEQAIKSRRERAGKVRRFKSDGAIGENKLALLEMRSSSLPADQQQEARALVKAENRDRQIIYQEIAQQNGKTSVEDLADIQQAWAEVNRAKSRPGDWIQAPTDANYYRRFLRTSLAQSLDEKPEPGAWIRVPKGVTPEGE
jgi:uncharacterized protein YdbL (DUF1318 family)